MGTNVGVYIYVYIGMNVGVGKLVPSGLAARTLW